MNCTMNWINLDCGCDIKTRLLEAETQSARPGKEINPNRSHTGSLSLRVVDIDVNEFLAMEIIRGTPQAFLKWNLLP
jgi:hypothetical protein